MLFIFIIYSIRPGYYAFRGTKRKTRNKRDRLINVFQEEYNLWIELYSN